jgi:hypothetical protein
MFKGPPEWYDDPDKPEWTGNKFWLSTPGSKGKRWSRLDLVKDKIISAWNGGELVPVMAERHGVSRSRMNEYLAGLRRESAIKPRKTRPPYKRVFRHV